MSGLVYFPKLYPDELIYSALARYWVHSGYLCYRDLEEDLFLKYAHKASNCFVKNLKSEVIEVMRGHESWQKTIIEHTMFPCFGRFVTQERRHQGLQKLNKMEGNIGRVLGIPNASKRKKYFSICPLCALEDRGKYGETYWHRVHQLRDVAVCTIHNCYLVESEIELDVEREPVPHAADMFFEEIGAGNVEKLIVACHNRVELELAQYMIDVFRCDIKMQNTVEIGRFLQHNMIGTPYISNCGEYTFYKT